MSEETLTGYVTLQQIAAFLHISDKTLRKKLIPLRPFLNYNKRKRIYSPDEWNFVIKNVEIKDNGTLRKLTELNGR